MLYISRHQLKMSLRRRLHLLLLLVTLAGGAHAETWQEGPNRFIAGLPSHVFEFHTAPEVHGRQRQANWCWAAVIQMVLNWHDVIITQEEVVQRIYADKRDAPATLAQILAALHLTAPDMRGRYSIVSASATPTVQQIIDDLTDRWPLIIGLTGDPIGHAYVLTGVYYHFDQHTRPVIDRVVLRDPLPGKPSRQEMTWDEFLTKAMWLIRVRVERI
jgi:ABC-type bacteriocin/lantibiotic exporter with double-glycine peptidase domain